MSTPEGSASLFVMVGDLSADRHTAKLLDRLQKTAPDLHIWGVGGPDMLETGFERLYNCQEFAVFGVVEAAKQLRFFAHLRHKLLDEVQRRQPTAILLVDFGGFNLSLATALRKRVPHIPILYFISPQVWASRPWRIKTIARTVTKMMVIFPFEEELYTKRGVPAKFVGNPLLSNLPDPDSLRNREMFSGKIGVERSQVERTFIVGIFAGSRNREIAAILPVTLKAAQQLLERRDDIDFVISQGNAELAQRIKETIAKQNLPPHIAKRIHLIDSELNHELMANADIVWAKSGTTTLEVALFGTPMLILYRGALLSYLLFRIFVTVKHVGWPNLLAGELLAPELIQLDCRAGLLVRYTNDLLDVPALRQEIKKKLLTLRSQLGQGDYVTNCVKEILNAIASSSPSSKGSRQNV